MYQISLNKQKGIIIFKRQVYSIFLSFQYFCLVFSSTHTLHIFQLVLPLMTDLLQLNQYYSIMDVLESSSLSWIFIPDHHHHPWLATLSWVTFFFLTFLVPVFSHFIVYDCSDCGINSRRPFDWIVQVSISLFSTLSYVSLWRFTRKHGLRRFLFLNKLDCVGDQVRKRYTEELHVCVFVIVLTF